MKQQQKLLLIPMLIFILAASALLPACGAKGDLFLPDLKPEMEKEMKQKNVSNPENLNQ